MSAWASSAIGMETLKLFSMIMYGYMEEQNWVEHFIKGLNILLKGLELVGN